MFLIINQDSIRLHRWRN